MNFVWWDYPNLGYVVNAKADQTRRCIGNLVMEIVQGMERWRGRAGWAEEGIGDL